MTEREKRKLQLTVTAVVTGAVAVLRLAIDALRVDYGQENESDGSELDRSREKRSTYNLSMTASCCRQSGSRFIAESLRPGRWKNARANRS